MTIKAFGIKCRHVVTKEPCPLRNVGGCQSDSRCVGVIGCICRVKVDDAESDEEIAASIGERVSKECGSQFFNVHGGMVMLAAYRDNSESVCFVPGNWVTRNGKLIKCP